MSVLIDIMIQEYKRAHLAIPPVSGVWAVHHQVAPLAMQVHLGSLLQLPAYARLDISQLHQLSSCVQPASIPV